MLVLLFTEVLYFMVGRTWLSLFTLRSLFSPQIFIDTAGKEVINALWGAFSAVKRLSSSQAIAVNGLDRLHSTSQHQSNHKVSP